MFTTFATVLLSVAAPTFALTHGVDSSRLVPEATYAKAKGEGFTKAVIRGYAETCSVGGAVDPNFVESYNNAKAAGYTDFDTYLFPCVGSGKGCKSFTDQANELATAISSNKLSVGTVYVDFETPACGAWNYGTAGNLDHAKALVAAVKATGLKTGVYTTPGVWSNLFGSFDVVLDSSLPLWFATWNGNEDLNMETKFGGWTTAVGHQYTNVSASGFFDLDVFA